MDHKYITYKNLILGNAWTMYDVKTNIKLEYEHSIATSLDIINTLSKWIASCCVFVIRLGYVIKVF